jgi:hypothetical protein
MKPGYLYVLVHPSNANLYKIGVTVLHPKGRLAQHNRNHAEVAGAIVKESGQEWELKTYIDVADPYWAEAVFWGATGLAEIPYRGGVEVATLDWASVQAGLDAAKEAGERPPKPVPDWVHAYGAWTNQRLEGRGITLLGHVRSKFGKSDFKCSNGHQWRAVPNDVAQGEGCPRCGIGKKEPEAALNAARPAVLCLLLHPEQPGLVKIGMAHCELERCHEQNDWGEWEIHRYRRVDDPVLAEALVWELLACPRPKDGEPIRIGLGRAEQAFRELVPRMHRELASAAKAGSSDADVRRCAGRGPAKGSTSRR